jgi:alpha-tubulin suppressor-like RCC1 family protein
VQAAASAVTNEANLLKDIAEEVAHERLRERSIFALEHRKIVELIQNKSVAVERNGLVYARKQKELADHEEDLKKRRLDVKYYQEQLTDVRQQTAAHLKELRTMSDALYKLRVKLRDDTAENQRLEKQIRVLEEGR